MKSLMLLLIILLPFLSAHAQDENYAACKNAWVVKGKVLPWTTFMFPFHGINYTVGMEYDFNRVNGIGFELVYNDNRTYKHYANDSAGPWAFSVGRGVFVYYRRYFKTCGSYMDRKLEHIGDGPVLPYVSAFARYGKTDAHYQKDFETNNITHDEWQYSAGLLFGIVRSFLDVNMGPFYKQTYISDADNIGNSKVLSSHMRPTFGFRIGVNVFYVAKKKSNHLLAEYARKNQCLSEPFAPN